MGIISAGIEKASGNNQHKKEDSPKSGESKTKTEVLSEAGIDFRRANEAEKLAAIPEERFVEIIEYKNERGYSPACCVSSSLCLRVAQFRRACSRP